MTRSFAIRLDDLRVMLFNPAVGVCVDGDHEPIALDAAHARPFRGTACSALGCGGANGVDTEASAIGEKEKAPWGNQDRSRKRGPSPMPGAASGGARPLNDERRSVWEQIMSKVRFR